MQLEWYLTLKFCYITGSFTCNNFVFHHIASNSSVAYMHVVMNDLYIYINVSKLNDKMAFYTHQGLIIRGLALAEPNWVTSHDCSESDFWLLAP